MKRHALVTGATGFLGHHLALKLIQDGWRVSALLRTGSEASPRMELLHSLGVESLAFLTGSEAEGLVKDARPDAVFHLATHYLKDHVAADVPILIDSNVTFGTHVLEGLRGSGTAIVSAMSYFQFRGGIPAPASLYSATKQAFLDISDYYRVVAGLDIKQVILYDTFGPRDTRDKLVPNVLAALAAGRAIELGPSAQQINLLYVDDVISGLIAAVEPQEAPLLSLRSPINVTVGEFVRILGEVVGTPLTCSFNEAGNVNEAVLSAGNWLTPVGWPGARPLAEGLELTWRLTSA